MHIDSLRQFRSSFGLINAPCKAVATEFMTWQQPILKPFEFELASEAIESDLPTALKALIPRTASIITRFLFWSLGDWTLYFDNAINGTDAGPPQLLSMRMGVHAIRVVASDQKVDNEGRTREYGATILEYYARGNARRVVYAANDGGKWRFDQTGEPFPFEDLDHYKIRPIKERFNHPILFRYLRALGVPLEDQMQPHSATHADEGVLIKKHGRKLPTLRQVYE